MKKRILFLLCAIMIAASLTACGKGVVSEPVAQKTELNVTDDFELLKKEALTTEDWLMHLKDELLPYWTGKDATDNSNVLYPTWRGNDGALLPDNAVMYPQEIKNALATNDATTGGPEYMDIHNDYVRMHARQTFLYAVAFNMTGEEQYLDLCRQGRDALIEAFDENTMNESKTAMGTHVRKSRETGVWDQDPSLRTSQDLSYAVQGLAVYYYLTRDAQTFDYIELAKNYIFENYYDSENHIITWFPKDSDYPQHVALVSQLDQLNAYLMLLTPIVPESYSEEWISDTKLVADIIMEQFYNEEADCISSYIVDGVKSSWGYKDTDFGHTCKTYWILKRVSAITGDPKYDEFASQKLDSALERAYQDEYGAWAQCLNEDGSINLDVAWWVFAEIDQAVEICALQDLTYLNYLNNTQPFYLENFVDHENGGTWDHFNYTNMKPSADKPKLTIWKNGFHESEHALFSYIFAGQTHNNGIDLYYAFDSEDVAKSASPYLFKADVKGVEKQEELKGLTKFKISFKDIR